MRKPNPDSSKDLQVQGASPRSKASSRERPSSGLVGCFLFMSLLIKASYLDLQIKKQKSKFQIVKLTQSVCNLTKDCVPACDMEISGEPGGAIGLVVGVPDFWWL